MALRFPAQPRFMFIVALAAVFAGCVVKEEVPTIAHTHIGHALIGWTKTPGKVGLFVQSEKRAGELSEKLAAVDTTASLGTLKRRTSLLGEIIEPDGPESEAAYGLEGAFNGTLSHLKFARTSADATDNVGRSVDEILRNSAAISDRISLVAVLLDEVQSATSQGEAVTIVKDAATAAKDIVDGPDYNLVRMRADLAAMIERENPPYRPVSEKWLFGIVQLEGGEWRFPNVLLGKGGGKRY